MLLAVVVTVAMAKAQQPSEPARCVVDRADAPTTSGTEREQLTRQDERALLQCLSRLKGLASQKDDSVNLTLLNGRAITLQGNPKACRRDDTRRCKRYSLIAYYPAQQVFVVAVSYYEDRQFALVSRRAGQITMMDAEPHFSPSGKRFVSVAPNDAYVQDIKDLEVFAFNAGESRLEWTYQNKERSEVLRFAGWDGDDTIKLRLTRSGFAAKEFDALAVRSRYGWELKKPAQ